MSNVQWMDPAYLRVHRSTPIETEAGAASRRMEHPVTWIAHAARGRPKPSMVPRLRKVPRIHGTDHHMPIQGDCRE